MANAKHDENGRPVITGISNSDGVTVTVITADKDTHGLSIDDNTTGNDVGNNNGVAMIDENGVATLTALASDGTIVNLYVDPATNKLLINSN